MCGCNSRAGVAYEVTFGNGAPSQKYDTPGEAQAAIVAAGNPAGSSYKAVSK